MPVSETKSQMISMLKEKNIPYNDINDFCLKVFFPKNNMEKVPCEIYFVSDNLSMMQIKCSNLFNFRENKASGLVACNHANQNATFARFYLDDNCDAIATVSQMYGGSIPISHAFLIAYSFADEVDKNYPMFAKQKWA